MPLGKCASAPRKNGAVGRILATYPRIQLAALLGSLLPLNHSQEKLTQSSDSR